MTRLEWDSVAYEEGLDRGVYYPPTGPGKPWNGLVAVTEAPKDIDDSTRYIDGVKTHNRRREGEFAGTIEAFTFPDSFYEDILMQRRRKTYGLSYRKTKADGYLVHLVYNLSNTPGEIFHQQSEIAPFAWDFTTLPIQTPGAKMSAHLIVDSTKAYSWVLQDFEDILYGTEAADARLPTPEEIVAIFEAGAIVRVTDHGDGSFTVEGPDEFVYMLDATSWRVNWPSAVYIDADIYRLSSL